MFTRSPQQQPSTLTADDLQEFDIGRWLENQGHALTTILPALNALIQATRLKTNAAFEKKHRIVSILPISTTVWAVDTARTSKHSLPYIGPFTVSEVLPTGSYRIRNARDEIIRTRPYLTVVPPSTVTL